MGMETGIVINIGYGTTETVIFDDGVVVAGESLKSAVNTILSGLNSDGMDMEKTSLTDVAMYKKYKKESKIYATEIAETIKRWYNEKKILSKHNYDVVISGGGIMNSAMRQALNKMDIEFSVPNDALYSNAQGHFMRAEKNC